MAASVKQIMLQIIGNLNMQILKSNIFLTDGRCYYGGNVLLTDFTQVVDDNISLFGLVQPCHFAFLSRAFLKSGYLFGPYQKQGHPQRVS